MLRPEYKFEHNVTIMNLGDVHRGNIAFDKDLFYRCIARIKNDEDNDCEAISGTPYVWGGQSFEQGGFDCSGAIY